MLPELELYIRCDSDPYGIDKIVTFLKFAGEVLAREQYYTASQEGVREW